MAVPYAFVTLITSDAYLPGALTVAAALRDVHPSPRTAPEVDYQAVCLVTPETVDVTSIKLLRRAFDVVVGVEIIDHGNNQNLKLLGRPDLTTVLTKLHVFRLIQYSKIIFLDADVLPIRPLSHLFTLPHEFSAVPDVGWPDIFNSGVLVLSPGEEKFTQLTQLLKSKGTWDGGDQGLLNEWRGSNWNRLSFTYNTTPTSAYTYAPAYERFGSQISALHFIGPNKPWHSIPYRTPFTSGQSSSTETAYDYNSLLDRWFAVYDKHYRSESSILPASKPAFEFKKYVSVWNEKDASTSAPMNLNELRRLAISGHGHYPRSRAGEGDYRSLPLGGRIALIKPRRESLSRGTIMRLSMQDEDSDSSTVSAHSPNRQAATPSSGTTSLPPPEWMQLLPTPRPHEVPISPRLRPISLPVTPTPSTSTSSDHVQHMPHHVYGSQYHSSTASPESSSSPSLFISQRTDVPATPDSYFSSVWDEVADLPSSLRLRPPTIMTSSPDKGKFRTVLPWEEPSQRPPGRVFPSDSDSALFQKPNNQPPAMPDSQRQRRSMLSPLHTLSKSLSYSNAWDVDPTIKKYASKLARPSSSPLGLAPAFNNDEWRKVDKEYKDRGKGTDADSRDGDVEDEGVEDEDEQKRKSPEGSDPESTESNDSPTTPDDIKRRSQGIQTDPCGSRDEAIQVYPEVEVIAECKETSPARETTPQAQPPPIIDRAASAESTVTLKAISKEGKNDPISTSERSASPVPTPQSNVPADHLYPPAVTREISNESSLNSPASSVEPNSPADGQPITPSTRKGGRVWDPARGVDVFKRGSEEVLARFLKMGTWEEEPR